MGASSDNGTLINHVPTEGLRCEGDAGSAAVTASLAVCCRRGVHQVPTDGRMTKLESEPSITGEHPGVGTWCAPLMRQAAGEAIAVYMPASPCHLSPSVGTWLMHVPTHGNESDKASGKALTSKRKPLHMIPMSTRYGAAFHSCGVRPAMCCL